MKTHRLCICAHILLSLILRARWLAGFAQELTDRHAQRPPRSGFVLVGYPATTLGECAKTKLRRQLAAQPQRFLATRLPPLIAGHLTRFKPLF